MPAALSGFLWARSGRFTASGTRARRWCVRPIRAVAVVALVMAALVAMAPPAGAHDLGGRQPTDVRSRVTAVRPEAAGVTVRVVELGGRLELRNDSRVDVVIMGYDGEPYLRVGPA